MMNLVREHCFQYLLEFQSRSHKKMINLKTMCPWYSDARLALSLFNFSGPYNKGINSNLAYQLV